MDNNIMNSYLEWLNDDFIDQTTKDELKSIENKPEEIEDRFYQELEFGTAGLRGKIGAGTNRMNIYVSNLSWGTSSDSLQALFAQFGEVTSANIITDRETGRSRGFGFVEMPDDAAGQKAIDELNNTDFEGKTLSVNVARPKTERTGYDNRGGNGGGYNRRRY